MATTHPNMVGYGIMMSWSNETSEYVKTAFNITLPDNEWHVFYELSNGLVLFGGYEGLFIGTVSKPDTLKKYFEWYIIDDPDDPVDDLATKDDLLDFYKQDDRCEVETRLKRKLKQSGVSITHAHLHPISYDSSAKSCVIL